jgi:hypothetical protein
MKAPLHQSESRQLSARGRPGARPPAAEAWPTAAEWARRGRALAAREFRRLGVGPGRFAAATPWASRVLDVLGPDSFAEFGAVRAEGRVLWCNFELAGRLGFAVPRSNRLTPEFEEQLLAACSLRAVRPGEEVPAGAWVRMYADRYAGDGVAPALGAGRAGFLPFGNLYVKGVGFTPLFRHHDPDDFAHSHGAVHLDDCLCEAVFGEVNENLFAHGSARVVAVIDQGRCVTDPSGRPIPVALVVRAGAQLRPGHLLARHVRRQRPRLEQFADITRATGQLVTRRDEETGRPLPDARATMLRVIEDHARTAAEGFRWRMIHGALTPSNMEMSGAMLDLPTQSAQPRTAPIQSLFNPADSVFGREHVGRATQLTALYRTLSKGASPAERRRFNLTWVNVAREMNEAYGRHLRVELLRAAGLKEEAARRVGRERPELAARFADLVLRMAALRNPGTTRAWKSVVETVSVLDVFNLLGSLPRKHFAAPDADHAETVLADLKPVFAGNRHHVAKRRAEAAALAREFAALYRELMSACAVYAREYYGDLESMRASVAARAAFENRPLDALYFKSLNEALRRAIAAYRAGGDAELVRAEIDGRIAASLRSVDGLLAQGDARRLPGGGVELERRTIDGVSYAVRAWDDRAQTRRLRVCIPVERDGESLRHGVAGLPALTRRTIPSLRYRFTTDEWENSGEVGARLVRGARDGLRIDFEDLRGLPLVGRLEGVFQLRGPAGTERSTPQSGGYLFAVPDRRELLGLAAGPAADS